MKLVWVGNKKLKNFIDLIVKYTDLSGVLGYEAVYTSIILILLISLISYT